MELWYTEEHTPSTRFSIKVKKQLFSEKSPFQQIDIFDSEEFGRFFTLDGLMMLTEKDEFIYHDMIVHVPMATNPKIKRVLVIGGGDGGTVRELTRYKTIEKIDMVDIDELVVRTCMKLLPFTACELDDPRVSLHFEDGLKFVRTVEEKYDLIIVDSTDPFGPGEGLFTKEFYGNCFKALGDDGILVNQHENPFYESYSAAMKRAHQRIDLMLFRRGRQQRRCRGRGTKRTQRRGKRGKTTQVLFDLPGTYARRQQQGDGVFRGAVPVQQRTAARLRQRRKGTWRVGICRTHDAVFAQRAARRRSAGRRQNTPEARIMFFVVQKAAQLHAVGLRRL